MYGSLPSLNAFRAFEAAARQGSMSRAADELHVTPGVVSQQIRDLGVALFLRKPRQIALTETGAQMFPALRSAFRILREATDTARARSDLATLAIACTSGVASQWLLPASRGSNGCTPG